MRLAAHQPRSVRRGARRRLPRTPRSSSETPLVSALLERAADGAAPFHVPGHKRGQGGGAPLLAVAGPTALRHDLTELEGLDFLSSPSGSIAAAQALAARDFGAHRSFFLVNGTSCGLHALLLAACAPGDAVVLAANSHASAIAACVLAGARPFFAEAEVEAGCGVARPVRAAALAAALAAAAASGARVALALVVSPTYFGDCADVAALAAACAAARVPLGVDEAHGAHFAFAPGLPPSALAAGADAAVQSSHKTLGALTQASMLHLRAGGQLCATRVAAALALLQTSSPSYLLLASLDAARAGAAAEAAAALRCATRVRARLAAEAPRLPLLPPAPGARQDPCRLTVAARGLGRASGYEAAEELRLRWGMQCELAAPRCLVFALGGGNEGADAERLADALAAMHALAEAAGEAEAEAAEALPPLPRQAVSPRDAFFARREAVPLRAAVGRVCAETLCPYPPGIPVAHPGSELGAEVVRYLLAVLAGGGRVTAADPSCATVQVLAE